ncbi:MAG: VOC family protein [Gaiellaceae bacterium]
MPAPTLVLGAPCWIDLYSSDTERAKDFYGRLFGWTAVDPGPEYGGYFLFQKDGKTVAGCMANDGSADTPDTWTTYLHTDDADRTVEAAKANGAQVYVEPMDVTQNGRFAIVGDPGGAAVGIWQPRDVHGFEIRNEPGAAAWFELHTTAYDASVEFYREAFGWDAHTMSDEPDFRYTTLGQGDGALAGIMDATGHWPDDSPSAWEVYIQVEDADASVAQAVELGATLEDGPHDSPYGRHAGLTDPTGTRFRLVQS